MPLPRSTYHCRSLCCNDGFEFKTIQPGDDVALAFAGCDVRLTGDAQMLFRSQEFSGSLQERATIELVPAGVRVKPV